MTSKSTKTSVRIKRTFLRDGTPKDVGKFLKDGRSHRRWESREKAEEFIKRMKESGDFARYEIV